VPERARTPFLLALLALVVLVLSLSFREDPSPDVFFHLAAGKRIVTEHRVPRTNEFLAFERDHRFVDHEWLFQAASWVVYGLGGESLLGLVKTAIVLAAFSVLWLALRPAGSASALVALLPAILVAESRFVLRPEVVSLLGTASVVLILERERSGRAGWREVASLFVLQAVWSNIHGFALMGPGVTLAYLLGQAGLAALGPGAAARIGLDATNARPGRFLLLLGAQLAALLVNPSGVDGALYPLLIVFRASKDWGSGGLFMRIVELQSPFSAALSNVFEVVLLKVAIVAAALGFALSLAERRARLEHALAAIFLAGSATSYVRNLPFAAIGLSLPIAHGLAALARRFERRDALRSLALGAVALTALAVARASFADELHENSQYVARAGLGFSDFLRYDDAVSFLERSPPKGNIFNNFGAGHFLIFARDKESPLPYICGNTELYSDAYLVEYHDIVRGEKPFAPIFAARNITDALLDHRVEVSRDLIAAFASDPAWRLVHLDGHCVVYRKVDADTPPAVDVGAFIKSHAFDDTTRDPFVVTRALRKLGVIPELRPIPIEKLHLACLLDTIGRTGEALALAREAREERPDFPAAFYVLGSLEWRTDPRAAEKDGLEFARISSEPARGYTIAGQAALVLGDAKRAAAYFERALAVDPGFQLAQEDLLQAYLREEPPDTVALRRALASPLVTPDLKAFYEGQALNEDGRLADAEACYRKAIGAREGFAQAHWELGRCLFRRHAVAEARDELERVVKTLPRDGGAWYDLGGIQLAAGDRRAGRDSLEIAAQLRPRDPLPFVELGKSWLAEGDRARAEQAARDALARDSKCEKARELLAESQARPDK
jgi:tetratricopeptide (TPR) repeat protein